MKSGKNNRKKKRIINICLIVIALVLIIGVAIYFILNKEDTQSSVETEQESNSIGELDTSNEVSENVPNGDESGASSENATEASSSDSGDAQTSSAGLSFADLAEYSYCFASGAGAWTDEFDIEKDGYFHGSFHDSDMGGTGEGYENGTVYTSDYTGHFEGLEKIDDLTYKMKIKDIKTKKKPDEEEIDSVDKVKYVASSPYALSDAESFTIYMPGTPVKNFSEGIMAWINGGAGEDAIKDGKLTIMLIVNNPNDYGICAVKRLPAKERADMQYKSYKESVDYYDELIASASNAKEKANYEKKQCEIADDLLNELWTIMKYNSSDSEFQERLAKQREWLSKRDESSAKETMKRCEEIKGYIK